MHSTRVFGLVALLIVLAAPAFAAFPQVQATSQGSSSSSTTSHTVTLPSGVVDGDLLIVMFAPSFPEDITWPGGWVELYDVGMPGDPGAGAVAWKSASSEGADITVTSADAVTAGWIVYRIDGWSGNAPEAGTAVASSSAPDPDPPSLSPSWGAADTLWLVPLATDGSTPSAAPSGFTNLLSETATNSDQHSAEDENNTATYDPGTYTNASDQHVVNTIAIEPAGAGPSGPPAGSLQLSGVGL